MKIMNYWLPPLIFYASESDTKTLYENNELLITSIQIEYNLHGPYAQVFCKSTL
jgi:hypothetical protein